MRCARLKLLSFIAGSLACLTFALPAAAEQVKLPNGAELHVREAGSGPRTMVLIHGWSMSSDLWTRCSPHRRQGFVSWPTTFVGFGDSSKPPEGYDYKALVEDLHQLLDAKGIDRVILAGHSLGSFFIQDFAAAHPNRVDALVLTSPQPRTLQLSISPPIQKLIDDVGPDKDRRSFFTTNTPRYFAPAALSASDLDAFLAVNMKAAPQALQGTMQTAFTAAPLPPDSFRSGRSPRS
jgi:pimeloyl-ACP methyl ester carboxylesterase